MLRFGHARLEQSVPCIVRDGITLYADIYRPEAKGRYPVLLMRQPYGRTLASTVTQAHPLWYVRHGFMVVIQDVRGRGSSEGRFEPFIQEVEDGYDSVEWAASLPESNGSVGMYGFSYQGSTQWAAASAGPPSLKAIAPGMCGADLYRGMIYPQGRLAVNEHVPWAFQLARDEARRAGDEETEAFCTRVRRETPDELLYPLHENGNHPILQSYFPAYREWIEHPQYDAYWERRSWMKGYLANPIPAFQIGGWYDTFLMGTLLGYEEGLAAERSGQSGRLAHRLMIGPWDHIPWGRYAGTLDHGPEADGDVHLEQVKWFRRWLLDDGEYNNGDGVEDREGRASKETAEPEIRYYERGSGQWRTRQRGSVFGPGSGQLRLWLSGSAKPANGSLGGGKLTASLEEVESGGADVFVYDARLPMRLDGFQPHSRNGQQDRYEILVYTAKPLDASYWIFGSPKVRVRYQVVVGPSELVAVLSIVGRDGTAVFLTAGRTELTGEANDEGAWFGAEVELRPVGVQLNEGEALRLELTGSAYPLYARHVNGCSSGELHLAGPGDLAMATVAVDYVNGDGQGQSWLELPLADI